MHTGDNTAQVDWVFLQAISILCWHPKGQWVAVVKASHETCTLK